MSQKEVDGALILEKVKSGQILLKKASQLLGLSYPQTKRIWSNFKKFGPKGLISKKRGKQSNRAVPEEKCKEIIGIITEKYKGCKPLFISEKLEQYYQINLRKQKSCYLLLKELKFKK